MHICYLICYMKLIFTDCGVDTLVQLVEQTNFPWLMSNVFDLIEDMPLANGKLSTIIEWKGIKASAM